MPNYDVVIIGGGIAGLSLAYFLSPHRSVAVLEREEALGYHSTGRSAAEFVLRYNAPEICKLATISRAFFDRPPEGFSEVPLLRQRGGVMIAGAGKLDRFEKLLAEEREFTPEIQRLTKDEALACVPIRSSSPTMSQPPSTTRISGTSKSRTCSRATSRAPAATAATSSSAMKSVPLGIMDRAGCWARRPVRSGPRSSSTRPVPGRTRLPGSSA